MADRTVTFDILAHDRASGAFNEAGRSTDRLRVGLGNLAKAAAGLIVAKVGIDTFKSFVSEARESERVGRLSENAIRATGGAAQVTAKEVGDLANAISNKTGIDDEAIQTGENMLLTFKNIRNEVGKGNNIFDQATQAAVDLSIQFGGIDTASKALGKALNDPVNGMTALGKAGVTFTDQQKEQIKTLVASGDVLGAQKIILGEIQSQVGGAAAAAADPMQKLGVIVSNLKERIGLALLPAISATASWLGAHLPGALDATSRAFTALGQALAPIIESARMFFNALRTGMTEDEGTPIERLALTLRETLLPVLQAVGSFLEENWKPVLIGAAAVILALTSPLLAVVAGLVFAWTHFETFRDVVGTVATAVGDFWDRYRDRIVEVLTQVGDVFASAFAAVQIVVQQAVVVITDLWDRFGHTLLDKLRIAFEAIAEILHGALEILSGIFDLIKAVLTGKWGEAWDAIVEILHGAWEVIHGALRLALDEIALVFEAAKAGISAAWSAIWHGIATVVTDVVIDPAKRSFDGLVGFVTGMPGRIASAASGMWDGIKEAFRSAINWIIQKWNDLKFPSATFHIPHVPGTSIGGDITIGGWNLPNIPLLHSGGLITASMPRFPGDGPGERTVRTRVGELVMAEGAAAAGPLVGTMIVNTQQFRLKDEMRRLQLLRPAVRTA